MNSGTGQDLRRAPAAAAAGSRVAFLQRNAINESMGLCDLAGCLRDQGAFTRLFLQLEERRLPSRLREFDPHLVVIPCDLMGHNSALELARIAKDHTGAAVALGGVHPTFFPNVVLRPGVDYAFAGEAEGPVSDLLAAVRGGGDPSAIPNLILRQGDSYRVNPLRPLQTDMDAMAMPDREIYYRYPFLHAFPWKKFSTGRGCMNSCGYCFNPSYRAMINDPGCFYRRKSPERIVAEIDRTRRRHPLTMIHFSDDLFNSGVEWLEAFAAVFRSRVGVSFSANTYARFVTEYSIRLLAEAGCKVLALGVEVADDELRARALNKPLTTAQLTEAGRIIRRAGIRLVTFNILGLPYGSIEQDIQTARLAQTMETDHTRVTILTPFPKSALTDMMVRDGHLSPEFENRIYEVDDLPNWPAEDLFRRSDLVRTKRLFRLWHLMAARRLSPERMRWLVNRRWPQLLAPLSVLVAMLNEQKIFRMGYLKGFRYLLHVRSPGLKTSNYVSFI
jgi:radical SAM superfamily enzyme YgiQ (UPF0313 family)